MRKINIIFIIITLHLAVFNCKKDSTNQNISMNEEEKKLIGIWKSISPKIKENAIWEFKKNGTITSETEAMTFEGYFKVRDKKIIVTLPMKTIIYEIIEMKDNGIELKANIHDMEVLTSLTRQ